ncbi:hypothetical protein ZWY2020_040925 [Hordeum vulgare]|nr:hypothetical protein ZWY2020_040925 [Hordeum vulgare]
MSSLRSEGLVGRRRRSPLHGSLMERVLIFLSTDQGISTGSMRSVIPEENAAMAEEDRRNRRGLVRREAEEDLLQELVRQRRSCCRWRMTAWRLGFLVGWGINTRNCCGAE